VLAHQRSRTETVIGSPSLRPSAPRRWTSPSFHRPRGVDHTSGFGKTSRFLTDDVQSLCDVVQRTSVVPLVGTEIHEQVTVAVDELWR